MRDRRPWPALVAALAFLGWTLPDTWYTGGGGRELGLPIPEFSLNGWGGATAIAGVFAAAAVVWGVIRVAARSRMPRGIDLIDPLLATAVLTATLAGVVFPRGTGTGETSPAWGLWVAVAIGAVWSATGWRTLREDRRLRVAVGFTGPAGGDPSEGNPGPA